MKLITGINRQERLTSALDELAGEKVLRLREVKKMIGLSTSCIYEGIKEGFFPKPIKIGAGHYSAVGWRESEINSWLKDRIAERDGRAKAAS